MGVYQAARRFVWGEIPSSRQETRLLLKLDWFILSYCCLMVRFSETLSWLINDGFIPWSLQYFTNCGLLCLFILTKERLRYLDLKTGACTLLLVLPS